MIEVKLSEVLKSKGISQRWLAKQVGVYPNTVAQWINGNAKPSLVTAHKVAYVLDVDVSDIWCYKHQ